MNFLGGKGYLTNEDRKRSLQRSYNGFEFNSTIDLSGGVKVKWIFNGNPSIEEYSKSLSCFIAFHVGFIHCDLNGFPGYDTINFDISNIDFKINRPELDISNLPARKGTIDINNPCQK
jgi:hypothetical protein